MAERVSIVVFSGTADKIMAASIIASGAVAMGKEANLFLTFWGLMAFRKGAVEQTPLVGADFAAMGPQMAAVMQQHHVPSYLDTLRQAKELGDLHVHACAMTLDLFGLTQSDLDPIVEDVVGAGEFVDHAAEGQITLFI